MNKKVLLILPLVLLMTACNSKNIKINNDRCNVVIEEGIGYRVDKPSQTIYRGNDATFTITLDDDLCIDSISYEDIEIVENYNKVTVTLNEVKYSCFVSISTKSTIDENITNIVTYHFDNEDKIKMHSSSHTRTNTLPYHKSIKKDGYALIGYKDSNDNNYGLGSRFSQDITDLYPIYKKETPKEEFKYIEYGSSVNIEGYIGNSKDIVIPNKINNKPVLNILSKAFEGVVADTLVINERCMHIESEAFLNSSFKEIYLYDSLESIESNIFDGNSLLKTIHINAAVDPSYSGTYFNTFEDKMDRLISLKDKNKIILFSGSSARFGYDSSLIDKSFENYDVVNMGVFAYSNTKPEFELVRKFLIADDIFLEAPEFDTVPTQFATTDEFPVQMFNMCEGNYDLISYIDYQNYTDFFKSFKTYINTRHQMNTYSYEDSPSMFDENRNPCSYPTYNEYGDFIYIRPNGSNNAMYTTNYIDYTTEKINKESIACLNEELVKIKEIGAKVFFDFAPRNILSLSKESTIEERAKVQTLLEKTLFVPVIGNIEESLFEPKYFYEIDNHLSTEGVQIRTNITIEHLNKALKKS